MKFLSSNFYPSSFNFNLLRPTPLNYSFTHKALVFFFSTPTALGSFSSTTFLPDFINDLLVFLLRFSTGLGSFSSIDLAGFFSQFFYWVRRFFTKLPKWLHVWQGLRLRGKAIVMPWSRDSNIPGHVIPILISTSSNQTSNNYLVRWSYKTIAYSIILWCQTYLRINPQSRSWQWLGEEASFFLKATGLLKAQWCNKDGNGLALCSTSCLP